MRISILALVLMSLLGCRGGGNAGDSIDGRRIFVTNQSFSGNLGGTTGADQKCQLAATNAGLGGTWKAWLAVIGSTVSSRIVEAPPWVDIRGARLFSSEDDRDNAIPSFAMNKDEHGASVGDVRVWTNAWSTGLPQSADCGAWTNGSSALNGAVGAPASTIPGRWAANFENQSCATPAHLYCVEQEPLNAPQ